MSGIKSLHQNGNLFYPLTLGEAVQFEDGTKADVTEDEMDEIFDFTRNALFLEVWDDGRDGTSGAYLKRGVVSKIGEGWDFDNPNGAIYVSGVLTVPKETVNSRQWLTPEDGNIIIQSSNNPDFTCEWPEDYNIALVLNTTLDTVESHIILFYNRETNDSNVLMINYLMPLVQ